MEQKTDKHIIKIVIICMAVIAACMLSFAAVNLGVIRHADKKELTGLDTEMADIVEDSDGSLHIAFRAEEGIYINKLTFDIGQEYERPVELKVSVDCLVNGSEIKRYDHEDLNPIYVGTEVININRENVVGISISDAADEAGADANAEPVTDDTTAFEEQNTQGSAGFKITDVCVDNRIKLNLYVIGFAAAFTFAFAALWQYRSCLKTKPELVFLTIGIAMGLMMVMSLPRSKVGYDEETHMQGVFAIASFPSNELHFNDDALYQVVITEYNNPDAQPGTAEEMAELDTALSKNCDFRSGGNTPTFRVQIGRVPAYLAMAAGVKLAKLFNADWTSVILAMRLSNMAMYLLLMYAAIKLVPAGKSLMMFIALLPQNIFMAATCSYDPFIIGCMSLGYAFMLKGRRYLLPMILSFVLACMPKAVYAPVVLMGLGICLTIGAGEKKRPGVRNALYAAAGLMAFMLLIAVFILPSVIAPPDTGDLRGGDVSVMRQLRFILSEPFTYAAILFGQMAAWFGKCWFGPDCMTFMGHIVNGYTDFKGFYIPYLVMLTAILVFSHAVRIKQKKAAEGQTVKRLADDEQTARKLNADPGSVSSTALNFKQRLWILLMVFSASILVWTAMYLAFTVPGADEIAGVQGRYFIPLMFPAYLILSGFGCNAPAQPEASLLESKTSVCYYLFWLSELLLLALTVFYCVTRAFCM